MNITLKLRQLTGNLGVFSDGDWVESKDQDPSGDVRLIQLADIGMGEFKNKSERFMNNDKFELLKCTELIPGDILIARMPDPIGRSCIFPGDPMKCATVVDIAILRVDPAIANNRYVMHYLNSIEMLNEMKSYATGTTRKRIARTKLGSIDVPLPSLREQKRIADMLDMSQEVITKRSTSLNKLDALIHSVFLDMFSRSNNDYNTWKSYEIKQLSDDRKGGMRTGPFGSNLLHSEFVDSGIAVLGIDNAVDNVFKWKKKRYITEAKYEELKRYTAHPRDVIVTIMGTLGRSAVVPEDIPIAINTKHLACLSLDAKLANPYFISYALHSHPDIQAQIKLRTRGAIMGGLNLTLIKELKIKLPPVELQNKFEQIYLDIQKSLGAMEKSEEKIALLNESIKSKVFSKAGV